MTTIAVLNEKGGVGKTTIATHLARSIQMTGASTVLVDSDPQGSARDWYAAAEDNEKLPPVIGLDRPQLFKGFTQVTNAYEWVIIDGAPSVEALAVAAIKVSDILLIPVQPSPYDVWAAESLVEMVKARQEVTDGKPKAAFLISRAIVGTKVASEVEQALNEYELPVLKSRTCQRVIYSNSATGGSTVMDEEPAGEAAREIKELTEEVMSWR